MLLTVIRSVDGMDQDEERRMMCGEKDERQAWRYMKAFKTWLARTRSGEDNPKRSSELQSYSLLSRWERAVEERCALKLDYWFFFFPPSCSF